MGGEKQELDFFEVAGLMIHSIYESSGDKTGSRGLSCLAGAFVFGNLGAGCCPWEEGYGEDS